MFHNSLKMDQNIINAHMATLNFQPHTLWTPSLLPPALCSVLTSCLAVPLPLSFSFPSCLFPLSAIFGTASHHLSHPTCMNASYTHLFIKEVSTASCALNLDLCFVYIENSSCKVLLPHSNRCSVHHRHRYYPFCYGASTFTAQYK